MNTRFLYLYGVSFDIWNNKMEYKANIFVSQISLPDDEILNYIEHGVKVQQIVRAMKSDINLVAVRQML